jgi:hypothetical protein
VAVTVRIFERKVKHEAAVNSCGGKVMKLNKKQEIIAWLAKDKIAQSLGLCLSLPVICAILHLFLGPNVWPLGGIMAIAGLIKIWKSEKP